MGWGMEAEAGTSAPPPPPTILVVASVSSALIASCLLCEKKKQLLGEAQIPVMSLQPYAPTTGEHPGT